MSEAAPDESRLLAEAAAGDDAAFGTLVDRVLPRLRRWALVRTGDPDEAEDVVQETLIRMHRALPGFGGTGRVTTWLYRVLANVATDRSRARRPTPLQPVDTLGRQPDALRQLHARNLAAVVIDFFDALPAGQREVLELVDHEGMRPVEVAEALEMNPVTVRAHLFKARRTVRRRILERYPELMEGYEP